jgi:hypothetical protein
VPFTDIDGHSKPRLQLEQTGSSSFSVLRGFHYTVPGPGGATYEVDSGQDTDLASVPFFLTWFIRSYGRYTLAAVLHDYLWRKRKDVPLRTANHVFRMAMYDLKVPFIRRWIMWAGVSLAALSKVDGVWKARVGMWIGAVLGLDVLAVWVMTHGSRPFTVVLAVCLLAAGVALLLPRLSVALMGVPTVFLLLPAVVVVLLTELVYLIVDGVVSVGGWVRHRVASLLGHKAPPTLNPLFIQKETSLQRSDD